MDQKAQEILDKILEEEKKNGVKAQVGDDMSQDIILSRLEQAMYKLSDIDPDEFLDAMSAIIDSEDSDEDGDSEEASGEEISVEADSDDGDSTSGDGGKSPDPDEEGGARE